MERKFGCSDDVCEKAESIISERCFKETYPGDSRKWILSDGLRTKCDPPRLSSMKDGYRYPQKEERVNIGRRRDLLEQRLYEEAVQEIMRERSQPPPVEEYCTEYDGNYNAPGYTPAKRDPEKDIEIANKYPLYTTQPVTFYKFLVEKKETNASVIHGLTKPTDMGNPFKKHSGFTKSIIEGMDESSV